MGTEHGNYDLCWDLRLRIGYTQKVGGFFADSSGASRTTAKFKVNHV